MKKKIISCILIIFLCCNITLVCEESVSSKENLNKATTYYNSDNYQNALDYYVKAVQTRESNSGTTYYRLAYSWENVNPNASKYFSKFYSIAAYYFERDNDTENKYYSYSVNKEEKFNITHTNLDENKIQKIINNYLTEKKINYKKNKSSKKKDGESSDVLPIIIAAIVALFCTKKFGSKSGKNNSNKNTQTETKKIRYYCKYCGYSAGDIFTLTHGTCNNNPYGKNQNHSLYQGDPNGPFYCEYCGYSNRDLFQFTHRDCGLNPYGKTHSPYEGTIKDIWICEYCGYSNRDLFQFTHRDCNSKKSPNGKHHPAR